MSRGARLPRDRRRTSNKGEDGTCHGFLFQLNRRNLRLRNQKCCAALVGRKRPKNDRLSAPEACFTAEGRSDEFAKEQKQNAKT
jgi:hypothetical protein